MRIISYFFAIGALFFLFVSCGQPSEKGCHRQEQIERWLEDNGRQKVLCSTAMIEDIVKRVGGDQIDTIVLIPGQLDPHSYQLVKGDEEKFAHAEFIFYNGLGLEHNPSLRHLLEESSKSVAVGDRIGEKEPEELIYINGLVDPHLWMDVSIWSKVVGVVVEAFEKGGLDVKERAEMVRQDMLEVHEEIKELLAVVPQEKRYLVTSHDAFQYFARAYLAKADERMSGTWNQRSTAPEGIAPESMLSTTDIQEVIDYVVQHDIQVLFSESNVNTDSLKKIISALKEMGRMVRITEESLFSDAMGCDDDNYLTMMKHNGEVVAYQLMIKPAK